MTKSDLIFRNRKFAVGVLELVRRLPNDRIYDALTRQLVRCSTSVGANYRAACRAKSSANFINKLKIVEEEADESNYFLDMLLTIDSGRNRDTLNSLLKESGELTSIYSASLITIKAKLNRNRTS